MKAISCLLLVLLAVAFCQVPPAQAQGNWGPFGLRGGIAVDGKDENAAQLELFGRYKLPWSLRNRGGWGVATEAELAAGVLRSQEEYGFIGSIGPSFAVGNPKFPLQLDLGVSVAVLSRDEFGSRDYNGYAQFISHAALIYRATRNLGLSYRFQHMSNAGFNGSTNPGLNMHLFGVSWYAP